MSPSVTRLADEVGHLDADGLLAGDRGEDADLGGGEGVGQVVAQLGHAAHLDAGGELQLVPGDARAAHHPHHPRLDAEVGERLDELLGDLLVILAGAAAGRAALQDRRLRQPVGRAAGGGHGRRQHRRGLVERIVVLAECRHLGLGLGGDGRRRRRAPPRDRAPRRTGRRRRASRRPAGARAPGSARHAAPAVRRAARDTGGRPPRTGASRLRPPGPCACPRRASPRPSEAPVTSTTPTSVPSATRIETPIGPTRPFRPMRA